MKKKDTVMQDKDYEAENAADHLMRAEEMKSNKDLMKRAMPHLKKKMKSLKSLEKMMKAHNEVDMLEGEDDSEKIDSIDKIKTLRNKKAMMEE